MLRIMYIIFTAVIFAGCSAESGTLVIQGSDTLEPLTARLAAAFSSRKSAVEIKVSPGGSHKGIMALINGESDLADSSAGISTEELAAAEQKGVLIREYVIAYDLIVPIVHPSNPLNCVSMETLGGIFSGAVSDWKQAGGGPAGSIEVAVRDSFSGTADVWNRMVLGGKSPLKSAAAHSANTGILHSVANNRNAIGYLSRTFLNSDVKPLSVNCVKCVGNAFESADYPIKRKLFLYVDENRFSSAAKSFVIFIFSSEGQKIIEDAGFIPVSMSFVR